MILASKKTVGKRILPLLLAMVLLLLSLPATAFAASLTAVVTADSMAVYADSGLSRQVGSLAAGEIVSVERYSGGVAYFRYLDHRRLRLRPHGGHAARGKRGRRDAHTARRRAFLSAR